MYASCACLLFDGKDGGLSMTVPSQYRTKKNYFVYYKSMPMGRGSSSLSLEDYIPGGLSRTDCC